MIKYNLKCSNNHEFESWFADSSEFEKLNKKKLLECIYCHSKKIKKTIMAPMVSVAKKDKKNLEKIDKVFKNNKDNLIRIRNYIEKNFEFVGKNFSKKVREVYYDKENNKKIYGSMTSKERLDLAEEGIDLISIPWIEKDN
tara:strand:- start:6968 stop:7390 length:423 start_codon:yes stop_codon:yes gene_type:complete